MFSTNNDMTRDNNSPAYKQQDASDNKTARILTVSPRPLIDISKVAADVASVNHEESSIGPMKLKFLEVSPD